MISQPRHPSRAPLFDVLRAIAEGEASLRDAIARADAELLARQCDRHRLSAYVVDALERSGCEPGLAARPLRRQAMLTIARAMKTRAVAHAVLDLLARERITPVLLKGYGLATRLYDDPLCRQGGDVDILVPREQIDLVCDLLASGLGMERFSDTSLGDVFEEHHHIALISKSGSVDVHFRLFAGFGGAAFDMRQVLENTRSDQLDGRAVRYLSPEIEFVYLATHAANHAFSSVFWLVDLQRYVMRHPTLDFVRMGEIAHAAGVHTAVAAALELIRGRLATRLPESAERAFGIGRVRRFGYQTLLSSERLADGALMNGRVSGFLLRGWLAGGPVQSARHLLDGGARALRYSAASVHGAIPRDAKH